MKYDGKKFQCKTGEEKIEKEIRKAEKEMPNKLVCYARLPAVQIWAFSMHERLLEVHHQLNAHTSISINKICE